jgi:hypothetical protein
VVVPRVGFLWKFLDVCLNQKDCADQSFGDIAIGYAFKKNDRRLVVPTQLGNGYGLTEPWGFLWNL